MGAISTVELVTFLIGVFLAMLCCLIACAYGTSHYLKRSKERKVDRAMREYRAR